MAVKDAGRSMFACGGAMRRDFDGEQKRKLQTAVKISAFVDAVGAGCAIPPLTPLPDAVTTMRCVAKSGTHSLKASRLPDRAATSLQSPS
jgi:hypothetical protein